MHGRWNILKETLFLFGSSSQLIVTIRLTGYVLYFTVKTVLNFYAWDEAFNLMYCLFRMEMLWRVGSVMGQSKLLQSNHIYVSCPELIKQPTVCVV